MSRLKFLSPRLLRGAYRSFSRPMAALWLLARAHPPGQPITIPLRGGDLRVTEWKGWPKILLAAMNRPRWRCWSEAGSVVVDMDGRRLRIRVADTDRYSFHEILLLDHYGMARLPLEGRVVVDVGANVGYSAAAAAWRGARVIAFEAMPETAEACRANIELAAVGDRVELRREAVVGSDVTSLDLHYVPGRSWSASPFVSWVEHVEHGEARHVTVPTCHVNRVLSELPGIDWLKLNVEGSEWDILEQASDDGLRRVRRISAGMHDTGEPHLAERFRALACRLARLGFRLDAKPDLMRTAEGTTFPEHVALEAVRGDGA